MGLMFQEQYFSVFYVHIMYIRIVNIMYIRIGEKN